LGRVEEGFLWVGGWKEVNSTRRVVEKRQWSSTFR